MCLSVPGDTHGAVTGRRDEATTHTSSTNMPVHAMMKLLDGIGYHGDLIIVPVAGVVIARSWERANRICSASEAVVFVSAVVLVAGKTGV